MTVTLVSAVVSSHVSLDIGVPTSRLRPRRGREGVSGFNAVSTAMVISRQEQGWELIQFLMIESMR